MSVDVADRSRVYEIDETWKPSFLSNKEFSYLILEAFDGFMISFTSCGQICYVSETITSLLGYLPVNITKYNRINNMIFQTGYRHAKV